MRKGLPTVLVVAVLVFGAFSPVLAKPDNIGSPDIAQKDRGQYSNNYLKFELEVRV